MEGDPGLCRTSVSLKTLLKAVQGMEYGFLVELSNLEGHGWQTLTNHARPIEELLDKYESVFQMPKGLPPHRGHEHAIILKEGTSPVNVRPYKYPQVQKDEIERLVREMLEARIIQPSQSPFSSPVLLVKKKDGS